jgi:hypothetical protein
MSRYTLKKASLFSRTSLWAVLLSLPPLVYALSAQAVPPKDPLAQEAAPKDGSEDGQAPAPMPPETTLLAQCRLPMPKPSVKAPSVRIVLNPEEGEEHTYINQSWGRLGAPEDGFLTTLQTLTVQDRFFKDKEGTLLAEVDSLDSQLVGTLPQPILDLIAQLDLDGEKARLAFDKNGAPIKLLNSEKVANAMRARADQVREQMDSLFNAAELTPQEREGLNGLIDSVWLESARKVTAQRADEGLVNGNLDYFIASGQSFVMGQSQEIVLNRLGDTAIRATVWPIQLDKETLSICFKYKLTYKQDTEQSATQDGVSKGALPKTTNEKEKEPAKADPVSSEVLGAVKIRVNDGLPTRVEREEKARNKNILYELISVSALQITL